MGDNPWRCECTDKHSYEFFMYLNDHPAKVRFFFYCNHDGRNIFLIGNFSLTITLNYVAIVPMNFMVSRGTLHVLKFGTLKIAKQLALHRKYGLF